MKKLITAFLLLFCSVCFSQQIELEQWYRINTDTVNISVWLNSWGVYTYSLQIGEVTTSDRTNNVIAKATTKEDLYFPCVRYMVRSYAVILHEEEQYHLDMEGLTIITGDGDTFIFEFYRDLVWFMVHEIYPETNKELECAPIPGVFKLDR